MIFGSETILSSKVRRILLLLVYITAGSLITILYFKHHYNQYVIHLPSWNNSKRSHDAPATSTKYVPLVDSTETPIGRNNIFFIESTQPSSGILELNTRQVCSIESAARKNSELNIFLYVVDVKGYAFDAKNSRKWKILQSFKNIHVKTINAKNFTINTPLADRFQRGLNSIADYFIYHTSDLLRYTLLWKYSGTYLDLDVISQKPLNILGYNFAVEHQKNPTTLLAGAGVINFDSDAVGREISNIVINDLAKSFNGELWDDSSVRVLTRAIVQVCGTNQLSEISVKRCKGFKMYPAETFYPVSFKDRNFLMYPMYEKEAIEMTKNSVGVHVWNKMTASKKLKKTSHAALVQLAKKYCPLTFDSIKDYY